MKIDTNTNITVATRKGNLVSRLTSRSIGISLPSREEIPEGSLITRKSPEVTEQTRVFNYHPRRNSRMYPRFPPQLEKNHETSPSPRDEAQFPCFVCRPILCSQSDTLVALICLMEFQRDPKNTVTSLQGHGCYRTEVKYLCVPQINSR